MDNQQGSSKESSIKHNDIHHGTRKRYQKGCRCNQCRAAATRDKKKYRASKDFSDPNYFHGTVTGYDCGCRCEACKESRKQYLKALRKRAMKKGKGLKHGTHYAYVTLGCKCEACKKSESVYRAKLNSERSFNSPDFPHGTRSGYKQGCKCQSCKDATNAYGRLPANEKKSLARFNKRRAIQIGATDVSQLELIRKIYVGCPNGYTVDHIKPLSKGGKHTPGNLQYLSLSVNSKKGNKTDFDYSEHAIRWQDILGEPSTVIESTPETAEASRVPSSEGKRLASQADDDMTWTMGKAHSSLLKTRRTVK